MYPYYLLSALLTFFSLISSAQSLQNIRGKIVDSETQYPIAGCHIRLYQKGDFVEGKTTDIDGNFSFTQVPTGRYELSVAFLGYEPFYTDNLVVSSGKETLLNLALAEQAYVIEGVEVSSGSAFETRHESGWVSNRVFRAEETERYAGSRQDPPRMALNFAGVQGTDDSRNDIVVRGNSPLGLLWRYEDIEMFNPNHFAVAGATGGPISVFNNKVIGKSDFMTGAFPAGYGNALSGVFDLRMRKGNNQKYEHTFQFGLFGTELATEGPIHNGNGSYLAAYRYATFSIFEYLNVDLGTHAVPAYQDASFKVHYNTPKAGRFNLFGIGGLSNIDIVLSQYNEPQEELYGRKDRDQYFSTALGMLGLNHEFHINKNTFSQLTVAWSGNHIQSVHEQISRNPDFSLQSLEHKLAFNMAENKGSISWKLHHKVNKKNHFITGVYIDKYHFNYRDSIFNEFSQDWETRMDFQGFANAWLIQPYFQWNHKLNNRLKLTAGLHTQGFTLNQQWVVEPRAAVSYQLKPNQTLSAGYGLHSRLQPLYLYFYMQPDPNGVLQRHNQNMQFTRSHHMVLSYDVHFSPYFRMKCELYNQFLFNIPIDQNRTSSFSLINMGSGFDRFFPDELTNQGTGYNRGIELTLERSFYKNYFLLITGSWFHSQYQGSDGVWRNTDFNGHFATRVMGGAEYPVNSKKTQILSLGLGVTWAGGRRYGPVDTSLSLLSADVVFDDELRNTLQFKDFIRTDLRVGYKINAKKVFHEFMIDIINLFDRENILTITYDPEMLIVNPSETQPFRMQPQLRRLPVFFYKIHF